MLSEKAKYIKNKTKIQEVNTVLRTAFIILKLRLSLELSFIVEHNSVILDITGNCPYYPPRQTPGFSGNWDRFGIAFWVI